MKANQTLLFISDSIYSLPKVRINDWKQWILTLQTKWDLLLFLKYSDSLEKKTHHVDEIVHSQYLGNYSKSVVNNTSIISLFYNILKSKIIIINGIHYGWLIWFLTLFSDKKILVMAGDLRWRYKSQNIIFSKINRVLEYLSFKHAHSIIVSNEVVQKYVASNYNIRTYFLPYGADFTCYTAYNKTDLIKYPFLDSEYYLAISSEEPAIQNEMLLNAFTQLPNKKLVFVHEWKVENIEQVVINRYKAYSNIQFVLMPSNSRLLDVIKSNAKYYIHSSNRIEHEDDLIQAMFLKTPCIVYRNIHNRNLTNRMTPYFKTEKELIEILERNEINYNTQQLFEFANKKHTWISIGKKLLDIIDLTLTAKKHKSIRSYITILPKKELVSKQLGHLKQPRMFYE